MELSKKIIIIGAGFYGCEIALFLKNKGYKDITILEKENELLTKASYINQARVHNGYHYPRDFLTAYRSHENFHRFIKDYNFAIDDSFTKIYAIAKINSKTSSLQFERFIKKIGAPIRKAKKEYRDLFNPQLIEEVYETKEVAFDAKKLRIYFQKKLKQNNIPILFNTFVKKIENKKNKLILTTNKETYKADYVFNVTYAGLNYILKNSNLPILPLKQELTEIALITAPKELEGLGITVMDGPFFSTMPFPAKNCYSLTHVRYTPHSYWIDLENYVNPHLFKKTHKPKSNYLFMIKDAQRYLPSLSNTKYLKSLFTIKTLLLEKEEDDGRPILFAKDYGLKNFFIILGGKIDNIYDILEKLKNIF
ncbi:MAG: hypothetical protein KatS3mg093_385 [Candidatus Parcubacteria bacterium]|nr:MAG: hypothetical protein KatS3mg093_385 [Candidatus Parcubacteria bacterium]